MIRTSLLSAGFLVFVISGGCSGKNEEKKAEAEKPFVPEIRDNTEGLLFSWPSDGRYAIGMKVSDVPPDARSEVRVQDPSLPPEAADWVFLADLGKKLPDGRYMVRTISRQEYEKKIRPPPPPPPAPDVKQKVMGEHRVIMYMTPYCPVCRRARKWMRNRGVPFIEKNIESDPAAVQELQKKAEKQGIKIQGVPIFEVGGRIIPGFDEEILTKLLGNPTAA